MTQQGAKIGIRAPKETVVLRKELKITQEQNARAAEGASVAGSWSRPSEKLRP